ncbi:MAG: hypothetical protein IKB29_05675, partial [Clostridia bacterium]|nr:hypothetical protein [Clostridia bacterium]
MKPKLFKKYFFMTVSIVVISIIALMMIFSAVLNNHITKTSYQTLNNVCAQISEKYEIFSDAKTFLMVAEPLAKVAGADVFLADAYGTVHVCACGEWTMEEGCMHTSYILSRRILDRANAKDLNEVSTLTIGNGNLVVSGNEFALSVGIPAISISQADDFFAVNFASFQSKPQGGAGLNLSNSAGGGGVSIV